MPLPPSSSVPPSPGPAPAGSPAPRGPAAAAADLRLVELSMVLGEISQYFGPSPSNSPTQLDRKVRKCVFGPAAGL